MSASAARIEPVTADRWSDLETLFGPSGAYGGCWCMYFRLTSAEFSQGTKNHGALNHEALHGLVADGPPPGLLAYDEDQTPVGWCALAPRSEYGRVLRSRTTKPANPEDDRVWAITCFFIRRGRRDEGVASALLDAAIACAKKHGARIVEGYPVDTRGRRRANADLYYGTVGMFRAAGFTELDRRSPVRPIMQLPLRAT